MPVDRVDGSWGVIDSNDFNLFTRCFRKLFRKSVFTCWACVAVANPKVKINTERMSFFMLCIASVLSVMCCDIRWRGPKIKRDLLATPFQYLFLVYCSVEKLMHQRPNPIHFFFQREMARVEKMELCTGNISFKEFSTLHRKDSIVFAPSDQLGGCCLRKYSCQSA
jgi:hypothetical protein